MNNGLRMWQYTFSACLISVIPAMGQDGTISSRTKHNLEQQLSQRISQIRLEKKLIGLGAMILVDGKSVAKAVEGERKKGSGKRLETSDRWHVGSITKSMTATTIARLVEQRVVDWGTTIGEIFGETIEIHRDWRAVNLEQLLTHTSGAPANFSIVTNFRAPPEGKERVQARRNAVSGVLKLRPIGNPGESFAYSNVGFTIAAAMIEHKTERSWEDLVRDEVFSPLSMAGVGFGPPKDGDQTLSQPRGHANLGLMKVAVGEDADNSPIMGPAGSVNMTLDELCRFGYEHLLGETGQGKLLQAATYKRLHTAKLNEYAFGWVVPKKNPWIDQRIIWHNGSNTMWYALLVLLPERNTVISITSNDGNIKRAEEAAFQIVSEFANLL